MNSKFKSHNYREYKKIIDIINSCETEEHYMVAVNCGKVFGSNCDDRCYKLKKYWLFHWWDYDNYLQYINYKELCTIQVNNIIETLNTWWELFEKIRKESAEDREETQYKPIMGFNKVFKNKRGKR